MWTTGLMAAYWSILNIFFFLLMETLNDLEAVCVTYALYRRHKHQNALKRKRNHWVHPLNLKRVNEGQFQVLFMALREHPEKFFDYFRMSIIYFDTLVNNFTNTLFLI